TASSSRSSQKVSKPRSSSRACVRRVVTRCRASISAGRCRRASSWRLLSMRRRSCAVREEPMKRAASGIMVRASALAPVPLKRWIAAKLEGRPDTEHELALYRLAVGGLAGCYLLIAGWLEPHSGRDLIRSVAWLLVTYELVSLAIFGDLLLRPAASPARRLAGILLDLGALSYCMHVGGEIAAPLYPLYLMVIWANGFRFGTRYLLAAADTAVGSFALVTVATEFFAAHSALSLGLLGGLIVPALHLCTFTRRLRRPRQYVAAPGPASGSVPARVPEAAGDRVELTVQAPVADHESRTQAAEDEATRHAEPIRRLSVLVADDNAISRTLIA